MAVSATSKLDNYTQRPLAAPKDLELSELQNLSITLVISMKRLFSDIPLAFARLFQC